jgi:uncharacterized delta-60 repeat protein
MSFTSDVTPRDQTRWRQLPWILSAVWGFALLSGNYTQAQESLCVVPAEPNINIAVVRLDSNGAIDASFGDNGVRQLDLGPDAGGVGDTVWNLASDAQDRLLVFAAAKGPETRVDRDRLVIRLTAAGALDTTFATEGIYTLNLGNLNDNVRNGTVLADGHIVAAGYVSQPTWTGTQTANRAVLLRLHDDGTPDVAFGFEGVANENPFMPDDPVTQPWGMVEAYGLAQQSSGNYVTTGYGRSGATGTVDMVSLRLTPDGRLDPTWGVEGAVVLDLIGENDRGRNVAVLPDDRVLIVGTATPVSGNGDALVVVLNPDGTPAGDFDQDGMKIYDFGGTDENFYGLALAPSGNWAAAVGYSVTEGADGQATLVLLPLPGGADVAQVVPLSTAGDNRFWSVAFDASDRIYAAGHVTENGDNHMIVARLTTDGVLDPTFGVDGVASINLVTAGTEETARGIAIQSDGKIVIAGTVEAAATQP